tara:strand:+ start:7978 stop:8223 length:246 start_codon:yes stop_codon:yes gene_type:complete
MKFTIEENLPIPRPNVQWDFPVDSIKVGQALVVMCEDEDECKRGTNAARAVVWRLKNSGDSRRFKVSKTKEDIGFGIWRVE